MTKRKIGLVIANNYKETPLKLNFAESDALEIKKALEDKTFYQFEFEEPLINRNFNEVSKKTQQILKKAEQDDTVLIYFSGHGKLDSENNLYLMFNETELEYLETTSLPFESINRFVKNSRCENIITILDCCYSGAADEKGANFEKKIEENLEAASSGSGKIILTASAKYQPSKEDTELKHGIFTYYLLQGLKSEKVADEHGHITIDRLYNYAYEKTYQRNPQQTPLKKGKFKGEIIIGANPKKQKEIHFNENRTKLAKLHKDGQLKENLFYETINILSKDYENPTTLTAVEKEIKPHIERLLDGHITIQEYINAIGALKALYKSEVPSVSKENIKTDNMLNPTSKAESKDQGQDFHFPKDFFPPGVNIQGYPVFWILALRRAIYYGIFGFFVMGFIFDIIWRNSGLFFGLFFSVIFILVVAIFSYLRGVDYSTRGIVTYLNATSFVFYLRNTDEDWNLLKSKKGKLLLPIEVHFNSSKVIGPILMDESKIILTGHLWRTGEVFATKIWNIIPSKEDENKKTGI